MRSKRTKHEARFYHSFTIGDTILHAARRKLQIGKSENNDNQVLVDKANECVLRQAKPRADHVQIDRYTRKINGAREYFVSIQVLILIAKCQAGTYTNSIPKIFCCAYARTNHTLRSWTDGLRQGLSEVWSRVSDDFTRRCRNPR